MISCQQTMAAITARETPFWLANEIVPPTASDVAAFKEVMLLQNRFLWGAEPVPN